MAENRSFWRAIEAIGRGVFAPISLLAITCLVIVVAPSSDNHSASAVASLTRVFAAAGSGSAAGTTNNSTGTLGTSPTVASGYYSWTVPSTGRYQILAQGAQGGTKTGTSFNGGLGASVTTEWNLTAGQTLRVIVGHQGVSNSNAGGGGGASGVVALSGSPSTLLAVAGGGGGGGWSYHGNGGVTTTSGQNSGGTLGGTNGSGGQAGWFSGDCGIGGGGGGYTGNGSSSNGNGPSPDAGNTTGGRSYTNGGTGSTSGVCGAGGAGGFGFAGGGAGGYGGGGGGGYSGGAGGQYRYGADPRSGGGGGGSYAVGALTSTLVAGNKSGNGNVEITLLAPAPTTFAAQVASPTNASSLNYDVVFSETVTGLSISDFTVSGTSSGWSVASLSGSGATYVVNLSSSSPSSGTVILTMLQNAVLGDSSAQNGPGGDVAASTMTIDLDAPTSSFSSTPSSPASAMSLTFGVAFSESVLGIAASDFSNAGTAQGCVFTPSATSGASVNVVVTQCQEGTLQLQLASGGVVDAAGNSGPASVLRSSVITLAASALSVTAASQTVNFGGSWTDSYSQSGLIGSDSLTITYTYSGTMNDGTAYGPSSTKPTVGGSYSIIPAVAYGGANANRYSLTRTNGTLTISRISQSSLSVTSTSATFGSNLALTSSGGSGTGAVTWQVVSGTCTVSGSTLTPGDAGSSCVVRATKAQDTNYNAVSSVDTTISIARISQSSLSVTSTSATFGSNLALTSSGGSGTGAVTWQVVSGTCTVSGSTLTPGDAGSSCVVRATKAQDTNYLAANSSNTTISIGRASQSGFFITNVSSFVTGSNLSVTASGGQSGGSISWSVTSGICVLSGTSLAATRGGVSCTIEATRAGNTNYLSTSDSMSIVVDKITQSLTFQSSPPSSPLVGGTYTVSVTSDASLAPTVSIANSSSSVCSISAGVVSFLAPGSCLVSATQAGNDQYASAAASQQISVTAVPTTTTTTVPVTTPGSGTTPVASAPSTSIAPSAGAASAPSSSTTSTTTTTTTTTTVPNNSTGQGDSEVAAGEATAIVRGKRVKVDMKTVNGQLVVRLPNNVRVQVGAPKGSTSSASVNSDGVLVAQTRDEIAIGAEGFESGTTYTVTMFSTPVELGRGNVPKSGAVADIVTIPNKAESGEHTLVIEGVGPNAEVVAVSIGFKVLERSNNTWAAVVAIVLAIGLALLSGRPILRRRRKAA